MNFCKYDERKLERELLLPGPSEVLASCEKLNFRLDRILDVQFTTTETWRKVVLDNLSVCLCKYV